MTLETDMYQSTYQMDDFQFVAINLYSKCPVWYPFNFQRAAAESIKTRNMFLILEYGKVSAKKLVWGL